MEWITDLGAVTLITLSVGVLLGAVVYACAGPRDPW